MAINIPKVFVVCFIADKISGCVVAELPPAASPRTWLCAVQLVPQVIFEYVQFATPHTDPHGTVQFLL